MIKPLQARRPTWPNREGVITAMTKQGLFMGAAIGASPAGKDLYEALDRWLYRLPGGLVISNLGACALFAGSAVSAKGWCSAFAKKA